MKFQLTCAILLFLPLVLAGPVAKFFFTSFDDIYIIHVESKDAIFVYYKLDTKKHHLNFIARNNLKSPLDNLEIYLKPEVDVNFTVEFFVNKKRISSDLKDLVVSTSGQVSLRKPTKEEQRIVNDFRKWPERMEEDFRVIFDRGEIKAETSWLKEFKVHYGQKQDGNYLFNLDVTPMESYRARMILQNKTLPSKSFAIEHTLHYNKYDCQRDEADGLKSSYCYGDIRLENLKQYYKFRHDDEIL